MLLSRGGTVGYTGNSAAPQDFLECPDVCSTSVKLLIILCMLQGVLTESALALEAALTQEPDNAEGWRLLGTVHAENEDDVKVF